MQDLQSSLTRLAALETELAQSKFLIRDRHNHNNDRDDDEEGGDDKENNKDSSSSSPRGVEDHTALMKRYEQARDLYLQRRLENVLVDHIATFVKEKGEDDDDGNDDENDEGTMTTTMMRIDLPETMNEEEMAQLMEQNEHALQTLQTSLKTLHTQVDQLRQTHDVVRLRRQELQRMVQDLQAEEQEQEEEKTKNHDDTTMDIDDNEDDDDDDSVDSAMLQEEQSRLEALQQQKRVLQDRLTQIQRDAKEAEGRTRAKKAQIQLLQQQQDSSSSSIENSEDIQKKLQELVEMKDFYDSLRQVLEELGGVKIIAVEEVTPQTSEATQLCLSLLFCQEYPVQITLQVYRKIYLKLVDARWKTTNEEPLVVQSMTKDYSLPLEPLQDLVDTAISILGPPHDLRFIVRETLARIRLVQTRVNQLAELRHKYIMKVYGNQVTCSLNEGIIIVIRLYEKYVKLDELVGINGWDHSDTEEVRGNVQQRLETEYAQDDAEIALFGSKITPLLIVELVQEEIRRASANPRTPRMPIRGNGTTKNDGF